jgi:nucleoside-diphosphate-sugar epimerase
MTPSRVLVTGPTGFIGSRLCERLTLHYRLPYRAFVRRFTKANRIARMGAELAGGDLLKPDTIAAALEGCDAVVHLAHAEDAAAPAETANLIRASLRAGVKRFVHVSSIAVHGPAPGPDSTREDTARIRRYGEAYSDSKARVEERVRAAIRRNGLPAVILRPAIVYGPYGPFVTGVVETARRGEVSLIDDGTAVCNAVYVDDVCDAIHVGLTGDAGVGQAFFVTGDELLTWKDFILAFARMVEVPYRVTNYSSEEARRYWAGNRPTIRSNVRALMRLATSPSFHRELSTVPALGAAIVGVKRRLARLLLEEKKLLLKSRTQAPPPDPGLVAGPNWPGPGRLVRETCRVKFSNELAKRALGWKPRVSFRAGAELTRTWLAFARLLSAPR